MSFLQRGRRAERMFRKAILEATRDTEELEDMFDHVDAEIVIPIDIKGLKKIKRSDDSTNEHIHYIEITNVNGEEGWVCGRADYFAFELEDYWVVVDKMSLQEFVKEKWKEDRTIYSKPMLYRMYRRSGRKDKIMMVKSYDLCAMAYCIIKKLDL